MPLMCYSDFRALRTYLSAFLFSLFRLPAHAFHLLHDVLDGLRLSRLIKGVFRAPCSVLLDGPALMNALFFSKLPSQKHVLSCYPASSSASADTCCLMISSGRSKLSGIWNALSTPSSSFSSSAVSRLKANFKESGLNKSYQNF